jgi:diguanylate cyclase (GGDEF)-like protein
MEIKQYLRILIKRWWIIVAAVVATVIPTLVLVSRQPAVYESKATFVIRPRSSFAANEEEFVKAIDTLSRRVEINTTFAEVADSRLIKQRALERLNLTSQERSGLKVSGKVRAGTNVLEIIAEGRSPEAVRDFAEAVSLETKAYIGGLYDVFELEPLDSAEVPNSPLNSNKLVNIAMGGVLGSLLGVGLVFLLDYLQEPDQVYEDFNVVDEETGLYNRTYFNRRLAQELSRVKHNGRVFSLALVEVNHRNRASGNIIPIPAWKSSLQVLASVEPNLRDEDILAYLGESTFAFLLPDMGQEDALNLFEAMHIRMSMSTTEEIAETIHCAIGIIAYSGGEASTKKLMNWVTSALEEASDDHHGKVVLYKSKDARQPIQKIQIYPENSIEDLPIDEELIAETDDEGRGKVKFD